MKDIRKSKGESQGPDKQPASDTGQREDGKSEPVSNRADKVAILVFLITAFLTFCFGMIAVYVIAEVTDSGMLGICGPYGPAADWLFFIFLASFPASLAVGFLCGRSAYRQLKGNKDKR
jgi:hypothetical protein